MGVYNKLDLETVDGQKIIGGAENVQGTSKRLLVTQLYTAPRMQCSSVRGVVAALLVRLRVYGRTTSDNALHSRYVREANMGQLAE